MGKKKAIKVKKDAEKKSEEKNVPKALLLSDKYRPIAKERFRQLFGDIGKTDLSKVRLTNMDSQNPLAIKVKDPEYPNILVLNSPLIGMRKIDESEMDIFQNALRYAEATDCDAVLLTGNIIHFMAEKYGKERPHRTLSVDIPPKAELIKKSYPQVLQDEKSVEKRLEDGDPIFFTARVQLDHVLDALKKAFTDEKGKPFYSGQVYAVLGEMEESIINYLVNENIRVRVWQEKAKTAVEIRKLQAEFKKGKSKELEEKIIQLHEYDKIWVTMGNIPAFYTNALVKETRAYLTLRLEEIIPNCKVVGVGGAYFSTGKRKIGVVSVKNCSEINGGLAGKIRKQTLNFIKNSPGENIPDVLLGMGLNPYPNGLFVSHRVVSGIKTLDDVPMRAILQLPTCLNAKLYRTMVRHLTKITDKAAKVAAVSNFESGAVVVSWATDAPIFKPRLLKSDYLLNPKVFGSAELLKKNVKGEDKRSRYIYSYKEGCTHHGAANIATYTSLRDPERPIKFHYQVSFEALSQWKAPVYMYQNDGDTQHWLNYPVYKEGNNAPMPERLLKMLNDIEGGGLSEKEKLRLMKHLALQTRILSGIIQPEDQVEAFADSLMPYMDFFIGLIERSYESELVTAGDCGTIVWGQGNHNENSFKHGDVRFSEARMTRNAMLMRLFRNIKHESMGIAERSVYAGVYHDLGLTRGLFGMMPKGKKLDRPLSLNEVMALNTEENYFYALFVKHKQGSSKLEDNMKKMVDEFGSRGTADTFEANRFCVNLAGDDHMGGFALTRNALHLKTGGQQFEGAFGLRHAFPEQNIFSAIWGVPAGGPAWGPVRIVFLDYRAMRKYAHAVYDIKTERVFPNPI